MNTCLLLSIRPEQSVEFSLSMSESFLKACLIWCLLASTLTMNTRVRLSSVSFLASSGCRGFTRRGGQACFLWGALFRGRLGCLLSCSVLDLQKVSGLWIFSLSSSYFLLVAVNAFQHCFLGHQSLCFNFDIGRAWGLLLCIWYHLHENRSLIFIFLS